MTYIYTYDAFNYSWRAASTLKLFLENFWKASRTLPWVSWGVQGSRNNKNAKQIEGTNCLTRKTRTGKSKISNWYFPRPQTGRRATRTLTSWFQSCFPVSVKVSVIVFVKVSIKVLVKALRRSAPLALLERNERYERHERI